jgi:hypothetical protein
MPADIIDGKYNLTNIINSSSIGDLTSKISPLLIGPWLGISFLVVIYSVTFLYMVGLGRYRTSSCSLSALSLTMVASWLLLAMGVIIGWLMWIVIFLWIIQFLIIIFFSDE